MTTAADERSLSFEEFLDSECASTQKHEYVAGYIYALAGAGRQHNWIAALILGRLLEPALSKGCQILGSDMLLRASTDAGELGYYPDVQLVCDPADRHQRYIERPCMIVEVLSDSTRRIDRGEKPNAYRRLPSLQTYLLVWPDLRRVEHHWRDGQEWRLELIVGKGVVPIPCLDVELTLDDVYGPAERTEAQPTAAGQAG
jgi:Uma2 family endonuclease